MYTDILAQKNAEIVAQRALIARLEADNQQLSRSHLGILSSAAIRMALETMTTPVDLICIDLRKLHDLNDVLGYDVANRYFGTFARTRLHDELYLPPRRHDIRGQWGGDELVIATAPGDGMGLIMRMVLALDALTAELTPEQRQAITMRTGGLVDGFCAVFVLITNSTDPYHRVWDGETWSDAGDAARGVAACGPLKAGPVTGCRSTSGKPGTIIGSIAAGAR